MGRVRRFSPKGAARAAVAGGCAVALALAVAACGERQEPTGATVPDAYPVTVQAADEHPVAIDRRPRTVLPVSASAAAIVEALGLRGLVPGAPAAGPLRPFPVRAIAKTPVDLVVGSQTNDANALQSAVAAAQTTVVVVADSSIRDLEHSILAVGLALGAPVQARALVRAIDAQLAAVKGKLKGGVPVTVFVDTGFFIPVPDDTFAGEVLRAAGARNIAGNAEPTPYPIKALLAADPAFVLATTASGTSLKELRATKRVRNLTAVRDGRFALIPARLLQPTPDVGKAVERIAAIIHAAAPAATTAAATTAAATTTAGSP